VIYIAQSLRRLTAADCAALPTANAGQYATSHLKPLLFWILCKRRYINVGTFNLLTPHTLFSGVRQAAAHVLPLTLQWILQLKPSGTQEQGCLGCQSTTLEQ